MILINVKQCPSSICFSLLTRCAGITCHRTSRTFCPKIAIFSLSFKYISSITWAKQIINLSLVNNFYPVISYRRVQKEKKSNGLSYTVWSLVTVRNQKLPAQKWLKGKQKISVTIQLYVHSVPYFLTIWHII